MVIAKLDTNFFIIFHVLYSLHDGKLVFVANRCESKVVRVEAAGLKCMIFLFFFTT